jgi:alginate O-acetyltransferase complex protein AlgI
MSITSFNFFFALLLVLAVYYLLPRRAQNYWLLLVSYAFITTWAWEFSLVLLVITAANFFLARQIQKTEHNRQHLLWMGIGLNVFALLLFRSADFFLPGLLAVFSRLGIQLSQDSIVILLPIGMAFYALQNISYLVDVYRKQTVAATDFIDFALYLAYFPKLLAGPIERSRTFLPQLAQPRVVDNQKLARSVSLIVVGLIRKLLIASMLSALIFSEAYENPSAFTAPELIIWLFVYSFFLYNDFAGYTSIARGISGLFGIELSQNFKQPFFARDMAEFWNSWHITLSHWLRDYIYFPIGRALLRRNSSRRNLVNIVLPPVITMLVSGLWHGFGWNTLLWGGLHGFYQVFDVLASLRGPVIPPQKWPVWRQGLGIGMVFVLVSFAWVPFIMDLPTALSYWQGMFDWTYTDIRFRRILLFIPLAVGTLGLDWLQRLYQQEVFFLRWPRLVRSFLLATSLILLFILMQSEQMAPFVYQGF